MNNVLIVSNNSLANSDSNGRTLLNLISSLKNHFVFYQFSVNRKASDNNFIYQNYTLSDAQVLSGFKKLKFNLGNTNLEECASNKSQVKKRKNAITMLLRYYLWNMNLLFNNKLKRWLDSVKPQFVIFQAGDCLHMYKLVLKICKKHNSKLIIYNSEDYPFKNFDYFKKRLYRTPFYSFFNYKLRKYTKKTYKCSELNIFLTTKLLNLYKSKLKVCKNCHCIQNSSEIKPTIKNHFRREKIIRYFGNLDNSREKSILDIADIIKNNNLPFKIEIYSNHHIECFDSYSFIQQKGFVDYKELTSLIVSSDVNLHVESFDDFYKRDVENGFSTKIPDIIASNAFFLLYAPKNLYLTNFIRLNEIGFCATSKNELIEKLKEIAKANNNKYSKNMLNFAISNFDVGKNSKLFSGLFEELL